MSNNLLTILAGAALMAVMACNPPPKIYSSEEIIEICEQKRDEADGVTGGVNVGVNSESGPFIQVEVGINDKIDANLDPDQVYRDCIEIHQTHNIAARQEIARRANERN